MVKVLTPIKLAAFKKAVINSAAPGTSAVVVASDSEGKGMFVVALGHQPEGDTGAQNTAAPSTNGKESNAFKNESEVISSVTVDLITKVVGLGSGFGFIPWVAKSVLSSFISKPIRRLIDGRSFDCLIQVHSDMVKKYAIVGGPGDVIIYYGSDRGFAIANAIKASILSKNCDLIKTVNVIHHTKSWRGRLGFIADSADTALILEYDSVARDKNQMKSIADAINLSLIDVQPNLNTFKY